MLIGLVGLGFGAYRRRRNNAGLVAAFGTAFILALVPFAAKATPVTYDITTIQGDTGGAGEYFYLTGSFTFDSAVADEYTNSNPFTPNPVSSVNISYDYVAIGNPVGPPVTYAYFSYVNPNTPATGYDNYGTAGSPLCNLGDPYCFLALGSGAGLFQFGLQGGYFELFQDPVSGEPCSHEFSGCSAVFALGPVDTSGVSAVPIPAIGTGLPGLVLAGGGLFWWRHRRRRRWGGDSRARGAVVWHSREAA